MRLGGVEHARAGRAFFAGATVDVARRLLGAALVHRTSAGLAAGRIVEVEVYLARVDPGSHSFRGRTPRNAAMFARAGTAYVYLIYGMYHCFNVVTGERDVGEAVLVRALAPLAGLELMRARRGDVADRELCRGPGKLARALEIDRTLDGTDLVRGRLGVFVSRDRSSVEGEIDVSARIGLTRGAELPLRFFLASDPHVSR